VGRVEQRRRNLREATPFSVWSIDGEADFLLEEGVLVCRNKSIIRIIDLHGRGIESVIRFKEYINTQSGLSPWRDSTHTLKLLSYSNELLLCSLERARYDGCYLFAFDTNTGECIFQEPVYVSGQYHAFYVNRHIYWVSSQYQTDVEMENDSGGSYFAAPYVSQQWVVRGWKLDGQGSWQDGDREEEPHSTSSWLDVEIELDEISSDIGKTACFKVHDGWFYAISTQPPIGLDEVSFTSFYTCYRFLVSDPPLRGRKLTPILIPRRNVDEGAINDAWTTLQLVLNEETGYLQIIEGRREWIENSSRPIRSYYITDLNPEFFEPGVADMSRYIDQSRLDQIPWDYQALISNATYDVPFEPTWRRPNRTVHQVNAEEYLQSPTEYVHRHYDANCHSWVDLIQQDTQEEGVADVYLRVGTRKLLPSKSRFHNPGPDDWRFEEFEPRIWPTPDTLFSLPPVAKISRAFVRAAADERMLIYHTGLLNGKDGAGRKTQKGSLCIISFDPEIDFSRGAKDKQSKSVHTSSKRPWFSSRPRISKLQQLFQHREAH
jgi:hypothetical protein